MSSPKLERVLREYAEAKNRHDVDALLAACHPDCYYESAGIPGRIQGTKALRGFYSTLFEALPDYRGEFEGQAFAGETVAVWGHFSGTVTGDFMGRPAGGGRIEVPVVFLCTFKDGLIASDTGYFDVAKMLAQAGVDDAPRPLESSGGAGPVTEPAAEWVARWADAWSDPEPFKLADLVHPDAQHQYPFTEGPLDQAGLAEHFEQVLVLLPDLRITPIEWAATGNTVLIEWAATATVGGRRMEWQGADVFRLRDGRTVSGRAYYDTQPLRETLKAPQASAATS